MIFIIVILIIIVLIADSRQAVGKGGTYEGLITGSAELIKRYLKDKQPLSEIYTLHESIPIVLQQAIEGQIAKSKQKEIILNKLILNTILHIRAMKVYPNSLSARCLKRDIEGLKKLRSHNETYTTGIDDLTYDANQALSRTGIVTIKDVPKCTPLAETLLLGACTKLTGCSCPSSTSCTCPSSTSCTCPDDTTVARLRKDLADEKETTERLRRELRNSGSSYECTREKEELYKRIQVLKDDLDLLRARSLSSSALSSSAELRECQQRVSSLQDEKRRLQELLNDTLAHQKSSINQAEYEDLQRRLHNCESGCSLIQQRLIECENRHYVPDKGTGYIPANANPIWPADDIDQP